MTPKRSGPIRGLVWVSCVLFQLTILAQGQMNSPLDGEAFNATIAQIEGTRRLEVSTSRPYFFTFGLPSNGTTNADALITVSSLRHVNVDIFCLPRAPMDLLRGFIGFRTAPWRSNHTHGDDFVFISQHHPRYAEGLRGTPDGDGLVVTCAIENYEVQPVSVLVNIDLDYETIELRQEAEEALESIFTKCCQSEDSCKAWKEHRSNNDSVQSDLCHFHTNVCNTDGHLYRLSLENLNMQCEFPYEEIIQFRQIKKLLLKGNNFKGDVGDVLKELSRLPDLEDVDISDSQLTGPLAIGRAMERSGICIITRGNLLYLNLERNNITGEVPACLLYSRSRVKTIDLAFNKLTGRLPRVSTFSQDLEALYLTGNQLTGEIPISYTETFSLEILDLSRNQLTGSVPGEFGVSPFLRQLYMSGNKLSGTFPEQLTETSTLRLLDLANNELTGELPDSIGDMESLAVLLLGSNKFTGSLPSSMANLSLLVTLSLYNNSLTGSIMNGLPSSLTFLDLRDNQFTGAIPASASQAGSAVRVRSIQLSNNNFSSFDDEWYGGRAPLYQLDLFDAANNSIKGSFPPPLADAPLLTQLDLSNNDLSGRLPSEATFFWSLLLLNLSSNAFTGPLPESWRRSRLFSRNEDTTVDLSFNQLSGSIPGFLYGIPMNRRVTKIIDLEGNDLDVECPLPKSLSFIHGLVCNPDHSALPPLEEASLSDIEGDLPKSLFETPADSSIEAPEAPYTTSTMNDTMSTERNIPTTPVDGRKEIESPSLSASNEETTGVAESQSFERDSNKKALWIPAVVAAGFALLLAMFFVIRKRSNSSKAAASGGAGGGRKPVPPISLSTLESSKALTPQREPSRDDGIHMLTGMQSSVEI